MNDNKRPFRTKIIHGVAYTLTTFQTYQTCIKRLAKNCDSSTGTATRTIIPLKCYLKKADKVP